MARTSTGSEPDLSQLPGLEVFLTALRHEGVPIGFMELDRLRRLLATAPVLHEVSELRQMLGCLLVKNDFQQAAFERAFLAWEAQWPRELAPAVPVDGDSAVDEDEEEVVVDKPPSVESDGKSLPVQPATEEQTAKQTQTQDRVAEEPGVTTPSWFHLLDRFDYRRWLPVGGLVGIGLLTLTTVSLLTESATTAEWLVLLAFTTTVGGLLGWWYWRQLRPPDALTPTRSGPEWLSFLPSTAGSGLCTQDEVREMVWSVGRYVSEDDTRRLDLAATVHRTANQGGIFSPCYERAVYPRTVWIWVDGSALTPLTERLGAEIEQHLGRSGLPVRRGVFARYPALIRWSDGEDFSPLVVEGFRQQAVVLVLSDGRGIANADRAGLTHRELGLLLEGLSGWRQLAFVDLGAGRHGMAEILRRYGIPCLMPWQAAAFVAGNDPGAGQRRLSLRLEDDLLTWAGALALSPGAPELETAQLLRERLGLRVDAWQLETLIQKGRVLERRLHFSRSLKARWLRQLVLAERGERDVPPKSALHRAVAFWLEWLEEQEHEQQTRETALRPWADTPATRELWLKQALLELWRDPDTGAEMLYRLWRLDSDWRQAVSEAVAGYVPWERASAGEESKDGEPIFLLPWWEQEQRAQVREWLAEMKFGSTVQPPPPGHIAIPSRWWTTLGLSGGMAIAAGLGIGGAAGYALVLAVAGGLFWVFRQHGQRPVENRPAHSPAGIETEIEQPEPEPIPPLNEPLVMLELDGGTFLMGSPESDDQAYGNERPQHQVSLSPFAMSRELVTRDLYREVMGSSPEIWQLDKNDNRLPANSVTWFKAVEFCNRLSDRVRLKPCYQTDSREVTWNREADGYRLPTEAEWEYACRAGTTTRWFCGDEPDELGEYAWYKENSGNRVHPAGEKRPNLWGLHDMAGNALGWCWDWYGEYSEDPQTDPDGPPPGDLRVLRGGAFDGEPRRLRSACRGRARPGDQNRVGSFRMVRGSRRQP